MTEWVAICVGWALVAVGFAGCFVPVLPGPPIAYAALLLLRFAGGGSSPETRLLVVAGVATAAATVLDYAVPALGAKAFKCSRAGVTGCVVGTLVGLFFLPFGVVLGPFAGALIGEATAGKEFGKALFGATGAFLGFVSGVLIKLACCGLLAFWFFRATTDRHCGAEGGGDGARDGTTLTSQTAVNHE